MEACLDWCFDVEQTPTSDWLFSYIVDHVPHGTYKASSKEELV